MVGVVHESVEKVLEPTGMRHDELFLLLVLAKHEHSKIYIGLAYTDGFEPFTDDSGGGRLESLHQVSDEVQQRHPSEHCLRLREG